LTDESVTELAVFHHFVEVARLPVLPDSVQKRQPPEPDVRCRTMQGEVVAFELVEVCNPRNARFLFSAHQMHASLMAAYEDLPLGTHEVFDQLFISRPLSFHFKPEASAISIRNRLPSLLTELTTTPEVNGEFVAFSRPVSRVVAKVRLGGRLNDPDAVNFNIGGHFDSTPPVDAISAKLTKNYRSDCPVELLAHFGAFAMGNDRSYRQSVLQLLEEQGLGPFRRVWLLEWDRIGLVFPDPSVIFSSKGDV
jgi:hypothetical protein